MKKIWFLSLSLVLILSGYSWANPQIKAVNIDAYNLVVQEGRLVKVPYEGSVPYSGSVPYTGFVPYELPYEGIVPFTYKSCDISTTCFTANGLSPVCPEDRWTDYESGKCPSSDDFPQYAVRCEDKWEWDKSDWPWEKIYKHHYFLENRDSCCKQDGNSGNWTCFGINPTIDLDPEDFCYNSCTESEVTVQIPYSGTITGELPYAGRINYSGTAGYSGTVDYITPDSDPYPEVVTQACVGDHIDGIQATGWTWKLKKVKYRILVLYQKPGMYQRDIVMKTDMEKEVIDGEFTDSIDSGFDLDREGTFIFKFKIIKPDGEVGSVKSKTISVGYCD